MSSAGEALLTSALTALRTIQGLGVHEGAPVQAAFPYALVEIGPETDWGHKSGEGRELRLAAIIKDQGERPVRLRRLVAEAETALTAMGAPEGWRLVTLLFLRSRMVREATGAAPAWAGIIEFRARMLREPA